MIYVEGTTSLIPGEIIQHPDEVGAPSRRHTRNHQMGDLVHTRTYIVGGDYEISEAFSALKRALPEHRVANTLVGVPVLGRPGVVIEIEARAVKARR